MENPYNTKYPMGEEQPVQVDCRNIECRFHGGAGMCMNISPAITLNQNGTFVCWSKRERNQK